MPVGHVADKLLDVDPPVAERTALLVGLGDLGLERDDALQAGYEVGHLSFLRLLWLAAGGGPGGPAGEAPAALLNLAASVPA